MRRRTLLAAVGAGGLTALAGCGALESEIKEMDAEGLRTCLPREQPGTFTAGAGTEQPVEMGVQNETSESWTVTVSVTKGEQPYVDRTVSLDGGGFEALLRREENAIEETGDYALSVSVAGGESVETTWQVCRGSFITVILVQEGGVLRFRKPDQSYDG
jgi:hypothetical protein